MNNAALIISSQKKNTDRGYTTAEIRAIIEACDLRLKVAVITKATTGMRIGALAELKLFCVTWSIQVIHHASLVRVNYILRS
jgi:integrase